MPHVGAHRQVDGLRRQFLGEENPQTVKNAGFMKMEVRGGIEPPNRSFADSGLTTWLPHHNWVWGIYNHVGGLFQVEFRFFY